MTNQLTKAEFNKRLNQKALQNLSEEESSSLSKFLNLLDKQLFVYDGKEKKFRATKNFGQYAFNMYTSHGLPYEITTSHIDKMFKEGVTVWFKLFSHV